MKTKFCNRCKTEKSVNDFSKSNAKKDGLNHFCRECNKAYKKKHYEQNKVLYIEKNNARKSVLKAFIDEIKANSKCVRCPESDIACLDFHHKDDNTKDFNVAQAITIGYSIDKIREEIAKCEILCSNCHRKHHYYS